jgi:hypothetical protein
MDTVTGHVATGKRAITMAGTGVKLATTTAVRARVGGMTMAATARETTGIMVTMKADAAITAITKSHASARAFSAPCLLQARCLL